jgi:phage terminase large subunit
MPKVRIDLSRIYEAINTAFHWLLDDDHRIQVLIGGGAASKSYSVGQAKLYKHLTEKGHRTLVIRKVGKTLRHSVFDLLLGIISSWDMGDLFKVNKTDMLITCLVTGNQFIFSGLDDVEKLKSIYGVTDIWIEEASEITEADFMQLNLRMRGESLNKKQITFTLNPIYIGHWIKKRFFDRVEPDCITHRSTYRDNEFLDSDSKKMLEGITDPYFKAVYVDGEWGVYGNVVFSNYIIEEFDYDETSLENVCQGLDFGFVHAQAIERLGFKDNDIYIFDELWAKGRTNDEFIADAQEYFGDKLNYMEMTADSANPDKIKEWNDKGYRVNPAKKGPGSLQFGIEFLVGKRIHIHASKCPNFAREIQSFKRKEDKDGNTKEDFVELNDDGIAAARYATEWIWSQTHGGISDFSTEDLGL